MQKWFLHSFKYRQLLFCNILTQNNFELNISFKFNTLNKYNQQDVQW